VDGFKAIRENLVNTIFYRTPISEIRDPDLWPGLPNTLDTPLSLLKPSGVPGEIDVDERAETLQIQSLRGGNRTRSFRRSRLHL
jgi:hypothetical protein